MKTKASKECQCGNGGETKLTFKDMQMMFPEYPDALDAKQVCEMLGTSTKTLYKMIDEGHITPVKVGRKYVFAKVKIVEFLLGKQLDILKELWYSVVAAAKAENHDFEYG